MSKELNTIDTLATELDEGSKTLEVVKLDDFSLALVGGGQADVVF